MLKLARFVKHLWSFVELFCLNFVMFSLQVFFFSWCMVNIFPELNNSEGSFSTAFFFNHGRHGNLHFPSQSILVPAYAYCHLQDAEASQLRNNKPKAVVHSSAVLFYRNADDLPHITLEAHLCRGDQCEMEYPICIRDSLLSLVLIR